jgi:hypothetical protein
MLAVLFFVAVLVGSGLVLLAMRIGRAVGPWHEPTTRWVRRARIDRRRRDVPVALDRRRGPRRQEEIAAQFLAEVATGRPRALVRRPAG